MCVPACLRLRPRHAVHDRVKPVGRLVVLGVAQALDMPELMQGYQLGVHAAVGRSLVELAPSLYSVSLEEREYEEERPMPAYAYLRKSVQKPGKNDISHEAQEQGIRDLAARHGDNHGELVFLADWNLSGRLGADRRPGYAQLLDAIGSGACTAVYSYSLSRLGRSVPELSRLIADCAKRGIPVRLVADQIDTSTATGRFMANTLTSLAELESELASERALAAYAVKRARGEQPGHGRKYGERKVLPDGTVQGEDEDVQAVLDAFSEAGSFAGAAKLLNDRGIRTRNAKPRKIRRVDGTVQERALWWPGSVASIIRRADPTAPRTMPRGAKAGGTDYILARLLRCPTCETRLTGYADRGGRRVRYVCRAGSAVPHPRTSITEHLALPPIRDEVALLKTPGQVEAESGDEVTRAELLANRNALLDLVGTFDRAEIERRARQFDEHIAKLEAKRQIIAVPRLDWAWPPRQINSVLRALFERIELDPETWQPVGFAWTVPEWRALTEGRFYQMPQSLPPIVQRS
jgi:DNA invertase Pin-like site-specific DNA recombinase